MKNNVLDNFPLCPPPPRKAQILFLLSSRFLWSWKELFQGNSGTRFLPGFFFFCKHCATAVVGPSGRMWGKTQKVMEERVSMPKVHWETGLYCVQCRPTPKEHAFPVNLASRSLLHMRCLRKPRKKKQFFDNVIKPQPRKKRRSGDHIRTEKNTLEILNLRADCTILERVFFWWLVFFGRVGGIIFDPSRV